jgi:ribonuclease E
MSGDSIRETLEQAYEQLSSGTDTGQDSPASAPAPEPTAAAADSAQAAPSEGKPSAAAGSGPSRDASGKFAKRKPGSEAPLKANGAAPAAPASSDAPGEPPAEPDAGKAPGAGTDEAGAATAEASTEANAATKPPQSWKPIAREKWAALPPEIQQEVLRRESDFTRAHEQDADSRKGWAAFQQAVAPFEGMIRAEGSEPVAAVRSLLQTAAALRTAPPAMRAQIVAGMVRNFGVPIDALDAALAGGAGGAGGGGPGTDGQAGQATAQYQTPQAFRDPRVDTLLAQIQRQEASRSQQSVQEFAASHEFFEDVRGEMADLIDAHRARGVELSLQQAYDKAVRMNDDVWQALQQRQQADAARKAQASTERAKAAASSVRSQPAAAPAAQSGDDIRSTLEAAWNSLSSR